MNTTTNGWAHANDRFAELWSGPFTSRDEAIHAARLDYGAGQTFYLSRTRPPTLADEVEEGWAFVCTEDPIEEITD